MRNEPSEECTAVVKEVEPEILHHLCVCVRARARKVYDVRVDADMKYMILAKYMTLGLMLMHCLVLMVLMLNAKQWMSINVHAINVHEHQP